MHKEVQSLVLYATSKKDHQKKSTLECRFSRIKYHLLKNGCTINVLIIISLVVTQIIISHCASVCLDIPRRSNALNRIGYDDRTILVKTRIVYKLRIFFSNVSQSPN